LFYAGGSKELAKQALLIHWVINSISPAYEIRRNLRNK
jgi:hypothetical protein